MNDFAIKVLNAQIGETHIFSVGQAGFIIKSKTGQLLGIDLYLSDCVERIEGHVGYKRMMPKILLPHELEFKLIVATHPHKDHFDDDSIPELMISGNTKLFASSECIHDVKRLGICNENITYVKPGDKFVEGDFELAFVTCDHGEGAPDAVGIIVKVDGKVIYETGDTCLRLDCVKEYLSEGNIDVMIAPINGMYGNLNHEECAMLANEIRPKVLIPCHYGMFASHRGDLDGFIEIMNLKYPSNKYLIMTMGEKYTIR